MREERTNFKLQDILDIDALRGKEARYMRIYGIEFIQ
jgi:hypothetical protein